MEDATDRLHIAFIGSADFVRRMTAFAGTRKFERDILAAGGNTSELKSLVLEKRPHFLLLEVGFKTTRGDIAWLHSALSELRERFEKKLYIVLALTTPEKCALAGSLLFRDEASIAPSGLIDNLIIGAPPGFPSLPALEEQFDNCSNCFLESMREHRSEINYLPALWDDNWVPSMCDPETRNVWMRWLPRYARYVNESPLVLGPTGSGKTRLAAALHLLSGRKGLFVSITPRDFSSTELVQAELFGAVSGAYTGAVEKWGLVKKADRGTLFIDELQSIDLDLQGKLITFIENKTYRRVGEAESHFADVRFVFASNVPLDELVKTNRLRDDFAYRLERLKLELRPLHERRLDIAAGVCFGLAKVLRERGHGGSPGKKDAHEGHFLEGLSVGAYRRMLATVWPGNLRQLENSLANMSELAGLRGVHLIDEDCVDTALQGLLGHREPSGSDIFAEAAGRIQKDAVSARLRSLSDCVQQFNEYARTIALERCGGDIERAAGLIDESPKAMELFSSAREKKT